MKIEKEIPLEEQMMRRQSAPMETAEEAALKTEEETAADGMDIITRAIGTDEIQKAQQILQKYKEGKANLEQRIIENEQWYKMRHWECIRKKSQANQKNPIEPSSGWLFNSIANKHASAMDNYPCPNILPREESDKAEAEVLSSIIPVILQQNDYEETYDRFWDYKLKAGTGVHGVFWDSSKLNGLGDISIQRIDLLNLFWEPGITDIQKSRNLFMVTLMDNELLEEAYPQLKDKLGNSTIQVNQYIYDDSIDTNGKSCVVDWYYKKVQNGKTVLHFCKFVNDEVLYATENETEPQMDEMGNVIRESMAVTGLYDHGMYPFDFDPLFSVEGSPCGFSYIDVGKEAQEYIDKGNQAILMNVLANARPRHFIREDGEVNEAEYLDLNSPLVHVSGNLGQDSIMPIPPNPLSQAYLAVIESKVNELKEVTGNRDVSTGGTTGGVTAASGLAAMQEAGSKLDRDSSKSSYRAFRRVVLMVIELIRQFYDDVRCFRIVGEGGAESFIEYTNARLKAQPQGDNEFGVDMGERIPLFDVEVNASKQSPYSKMSQNELALQFYQAGFFNPQMADQALACLDMMDFDRKQMIINKIEQNGTMFQQMMMMQSQMLSMAQALDALQGTNFAEQMASGMTGQPIPQAEGVTATDKEALGGEGKESSTTKKARQRVAESTSPT